MIFFSTGFFFFKLLWCLNFVSFVCWCLTLNNLPINFEKEFFFKHLIVFTMFYNYVTMVFVISRWQYRRVEVLDRGSICKFLFLLYLFVSLIFLAPFAFLPSFSFHFLFVVIIPKRCVITNF